MRSSTPAGPYRTAMITELWSTVAAGKETTLEQRGRARLASSYTAHSARQAMDLVYRHGGSTSFKRDSRLAECRRDPHTVGQTVTSRMLPDRRPRLSRPRPRPTSALIAKSRSLRALAGCGSQPVAVPHAMSSFA
jgi:hypothetical protein